MDKLHELAMAVIEAHEKVQDAGVNGSARTEESRDTCIALLTAHNAMPAFIAALKWQLLTHYDQWIGWSSDEDWEDDDCSVAYFINQQYRKLCEFLASIPGDSPELVALREALKEI